MFESGSVSHLVVSSSLRPYGPQHASLPCPSLSYGVCSNSCPLSQCESERKWSRSVLSDSLWPRGL